MIELTLEDCEALKAAVAQQICPDKDDSDNYYRLYQTISIAAINATIATIREYEKMKGAQ